MVAYKLDVESDTIWPVDIHTEQQPSIEWVMRYGSNDTIVAAALIAASLIYRYSALIDPDITEDEAIDKLKRARRCAAEAWKEVKG